MNEDEDVQGGDHLSVHASKMRVHKALQARHEINRPC